MDHALVLFISFIIIWLGGMHGLFRVSPVPLLVPLKFGLYYHKITSRVSFLLTPFYAFPLLQCKEGS